MVYFLHRYVYGWGESSGSIFRLCFIGVRVRWRDFEWDLAKAPKPAVKRALGFLSWISCLRQHFIPHCVFLLFRIATPDHANTLYWALLLCPQKEKIYRFRSRKWLHLTLLLCFEIKWNQWEMILIKSSGLFLCRTALSTMTPPWCAMLPPLTTQTGAPQSLVTDRMRLVLSWIMSRPCWSSTKLILCIIQTLCLSLSLLACWSSSQAPHSSSR